MAEFGVHEAKTLIGQALVEGHPVVTADQVFGRYGVEVVAAG